MRGYRLYIIDPFGGGVAETRRFAAPDDATAIWMSEGFRHSRPMELWNGPSKIHSCELFAELPGQGPGTTPDMAIPTIRVH